MSAAIGPGMRVKCINDSRWRPKGSGPSVGSVWTVEGIEPHPQMPGYVGLVLLEWTASFQAFGVRNFVPLAGNEDLSVLTGLLDKIRTPEKVS